MIGMSSTREDSLPRDELEGGAEVSLDDQNKAAQKAMLLEEICTPNTSLLDVPMVDKLVSEPGSVPDPDESPSTFADETEPQSPSLNELQGKASSSEVPSELTPNQGDDMPQVTAWRTKYLLQNNSNMKVDVDNTPVLEDALDNPVVQLKDIEMQDAPINNTDIQGLPSVEELVENHLATVQDDTATQTDPITEPNIQDIPSAAVLEQEIARLEKAEIPGKDLKLRKSKKRKRQDDGDGDSNGKGHKTKTDEHKGGKSRKKKKRARTSKMEDPLADDDTLREKPSNQDFSRPYGPSKSDWIWGPAKPPRPIVNYDNIVAPPPSIPDAYDDSPLPKPPKPPKAPARTKPAREKGKGPKEKQKKKGQSEEIFEEETVEEESEEPEPPPLPALLRMPAEVREDIYRHILIAEKPVLVRASWTRIFEREKPCIDTRILRVSKQIYAEAIRILYSENTFLYRLRDPHIQPVADVQSLSEDNPRSDDDNDDDYDSDAGSKDTSFVGSLSRRSRRRAAPDTRGAIDISKFGRLLRHLVVEAEHNRYSAETQKSMAAAINVFTSEPGSQTKACKEGTARGWVPKAANIHTLTLRINPMRSGQGFTFVDFFGQGSPVHNALKLLSTQFIKVEIVTNHLNKEAQAPRLKLDMRHRRFTRRAKRLHERNKDDFWKGDRAMLAERRQRVLRSFRALNHLQHHVLAGIKRCAPEYDEDDEEDNWWEDDEFVEYMDF
ncbi:hypothetical protein G7046_g1340 [Stylonectria norvegica]|nr:hypothetical protein G7046_g1340 [Stylonectria norvegica]